MHFIFLCLGICLSFLLHVKSISTDIQGLHSWRQSQTMWNIRNFVRHDSNILNPRTNIFNGTNDNVYRYEFPIMQWSIAMVQKVFGEKIEIVRLMMFLFGAFATIGMYLLVWQLCNSKFTAIVTAFLFQFSPIFYYYTFTPLPDILALTCGIWYIYFMLKFDKRLKIEYLILGSLFLLLSTLAKLPYLMFAIVGIQVFISLRSKLNYSKIIYFSAIQTLALFPALLWYIWVMPGWTGNPVLTGIFKVNYSMFEFVKLIGFHTIKMIPNKLLLFPVWIPFAIGVLQVLRNRNNFKWLLGLFGITSLYLFLQLTTIGRDHDYYLLPFLPWLFIVVSLGIHQIANNQKYRAIAIPAMCIISVLYTVFITKTWGSLEKTSFNKDVFIYSSELKNVVPDDELCIILNDVSGYIFSYRIDKMGYIFKDDSLPVEWLDDLVRNHNVKYVYSDSDKINNSPEFLNYVEKTIITKGSIVVFKLRIPDDKHG